MFTWCAVGKRCLEYFSIIASAVCALLLTVKLLQHLQWRDTIFITPCIGEEVCSSWGRGRGANEKFKGL